MRVHCWLLLFVLLLTPRAKKAGNFEVAQILQQQHPPSSPPRTPPSLPPPPLSFLSCFKGGEGGGQSDGWFNHNDEAVMNALNASPLAAIPVLCFN